MTIPILVGLMGLLSIVCVYFWLVRKRAHAPQSFSSANTGPEQ